MLFVPLIVELYNFEVDKIFNKKYVGLDRKVFDNIKLFKV